jgi:hypothetical protein
MGIIVRDLLQRVSQTMYQFQKYNSHPKLINSRTQQHLLFSTSQPLLRRHLGEDTKKPASYETDFKVIKKINYSSTTGTVASNLLSFLFRKKLAPATLV